VCSCEQNSVSQLWSINSSLAIWHHSVMCQPTQVNTPRLNPSQTGRYSIYLPRRDGRLGDLLHTEMVYPHADGHPSKYTRPSAD